MRTTLALVLAVMLPAPAAFADFYALLDAARLGDTAAVERLLAYGEDPDPPSYHDGYAPLQFAAGNGHVEMTRLLLAAGAATEYRDHNKDQALIWAARWGHAGTVALLLDAGSPPDSEHDPYHNSPLMDAARYARAEVIRLLLDAGADPNWRGQSQDTPLHRAALADDAAVVQMLLAAGADPNARDDVLGETPLHVAAVYADPTTIWALIVAGAILDIREENGETALFLAAKTGLGSNVVVLLAAGADADAASASGITPILAATASSTQMPGQAMAVAALAEVTTDLDRALVAALSRGFAPVALRLLERGADVNAVDNDGRSALAATTQQPGLTYFQLLVNRGADVERFGAQTLLAAAASGHTLIAGALLERGIGVDVRNASGATPLLLAAMNAHVDMVRLLLAAGADRAPVDISGAGMEEYMQTMPAFYESIIEDRQASRAFRPTEELEALLADMRARHAEVRLLLAGG